MVQKRRYTLMRDRDPEQSKAMISTLLSELKAEADRRSLDEGYMEVEAQTMVTLCRSILLIDSHDGASVERAEEIARHYLGRGDICFQEKDYQKAKTFYEMAKQLWLDGEEVRDRLDRFIPYGNPAINNFGKPFVRIFAGSFMMGSPEVEEGRKAVESLHRVTLTRDFYLSVHEVTRGDFERFANDNRYRTEAEKEGWVYRWSYSKKDFVKKNLSWRRPGFDQRDDHPVTCLNWWDGIHYCNWLSEQENLRPAYAITDDGVELNPEADGYRLPLEAEWEYACRAGTSTKFHAGDLKADLMKVSWCADNSENRTHPVGQKEPNAWGLHDMHGNVYEYCFDGHTDFRFLWDQLRYNYGFRFLNSVTDPSGPILGPDSASKAGRNQIMRGGGWAASPCYCRSAYRGLSEIGSRYDYSGIRIVRPIL